MKFYFSRRNFVRIISFGIAFCFMMAGCFYRQHLKLETAIRSISNTRQHSFSELTNALGEIHTSLQKGLYAVSPSMLNSLAIDLFGKSIAAQMALSEIPFSNVDLEKTADYIARVGDYALSLSKRNFSKQILTAKERKNLKALMKISEQLSQCLNEMQEQVNLGKITLENFEEAKKRLSETEDRSVSEHISSGLQKMEIEFPELPSLIYDGPFSAHVESISPAYLEGKTRAIPEQAKKAAEKMIKISTLQWIGNGEGRLPTYCFSAVSEQKQAYVEVTRIGGLVKSFSISRPFGKTVLSGEECVPIAKMFLEDNQFSSMKESYFTIYESVVTINFAYQQGEITCYPDLIKVSVSRDTGEIVGFDATGYLMCHTTRELPKASISPDNCRKRLASELTILSQALSVIRTSGETEYLCYEIKCKTPENQHIIFYLNALTGAEEKILLLLEDENGTLTI